MEKCIILELKYKSLKGSDYRTTSPRTNTYNCIAWAAGENHRPWWPIPESSPYYWPLENKDETLRDFEGCFEKLGYVVCDDESLEKGYEKVAIYVDEDQVPTHMARQLNSGRWTSKCGDYQDIEHELRDLEGADGFGYGTVVRIMKRAIKR